MSEIRMTLTRPDGAEVLITIDDDGTTTIQARNAPGLTCRALTAALEIAIGAVDSRRIDPQILARCANGTAAAGEEMELFRQAVKAGGNSGGWCG